MADVAMPRLSDSMEEGTILKWLKSDGDEVSRGEELVEIETDKATMTYEADKAGSLSIVAGEGDTVPVGQLIARIGAGQAGDGAGGEEQRDAGDGDEEPPGGEQVAVETSAGGMRRPPGQRTSPARRAPPTRSAPGAVTGAARATVA